MRTLPAYYAGPLRRALTRMSKLKDRENCSNVTQYILGMPATLAQTLIPDNAENCLSFSVNNYIKRLKSQAKAEYERLCNEILQRQVFHVIYYSLYNYCLFIY